MVAHTLTFFAFHVSSIRTRLPDWHDDPTLLQGTKKEKKRKKNEEKVEEINGERR